MNFYSEYGEDRWIAENLKLPDRGFYVDVGCAVPGSGSNTAFLRDRGWGGLVIDANPAYAALWLAGRASSFPKQRKKPGLRCFQSAPHC